VFNFSDRKGSKKGIKGTFWGGTKISQQQQRNEITWGFQKKGGGGETLLLPKGGKCQRIFLKPNALPLRKAGELTGLLQDKGIIERREMP